MSQSVVIRQYAGLIHFQGWQSVFQAVPYAEKRYLVRKFRHYRNLGQPCLMLHYAEFRRDGEIYCQEDIRPAGLDIESLEEYPFLVCVTSLSPGPHWISAPVQCTDRADAINWIHHCVTTAVVPYPFFIFVWHRVTDTCASTILDYPVDGWTIQGEYRRINCSLHEFFNLTSVPHA